MNDFDFYKFNINFLIVGALLAIVVLLMFIAFKDSPKHRKNEK